MKMAKIYIETCDDCPFYTSTLAQCECCAHTGSYWKCLKTGKLADDGWEVIPDWCPLENADVEKD